MAYCHVPASHSIWHTLAHFKVIIRYVFKYLDFEIFMVAMCKVMSVALLLGVSLQENLLLDRRYILPKSFIFAPLSFYR